MEGMYGADALTSVGARGGTELQTSRVMHVTGFAEEKDVEAKAGEGGIEMQACADLNLYRTRQLR